MTAQSSQECISRRSGVSVALELFENGVFDQILGVKTDGPGRNRAFVKFTHCRVHGEDRSAVRRTELQSTQPLALAGDLQHLIKA